MSREFFRARPLGLPNFSADGVGGGGNGRGPQETPDRRSRILNVVFRLGAAVRSLDTGIERTSYALHNRLWSGAENEEVPPGFSPIVMHKMVSEAKDAQDRDMQPALSAEAMNNLLFNYMMRTRPVVVLAQELMEEAVSGKPVTKERVMGLGSALSNLGLFLREGTFQPELMEGSREALRDPGMVAVQEAIEEENLYYLSCERVENTKRIKPVGDLAASPLLADFTTVYNDLLMAGEAVQQMREGESSGPNTKEQENFAAIGDCVELARLCLGDVLTNPSALTFPRMVILNRLLSRWDMHVVIHPMPIHWEDLPEETERRGLRLAQLNGQEGQRQRTLEPDHETGAEIQRKLKKLKEQGGNI